MVLLWPPAFLEGLQGTGTTFYKPLGTTSGAPRMLSGQFFFFHLTFIFFKYEIYCQVGFHTTQWPILKATVVKKGQAWACLAPDLPL